jgi:acyl carrier protein
MEEKLIEAFAEALMIERTLINDDLKYNEIEEWDSVAHMSLISEIEDKFEIMLDTDDIIDMSSYAKAKEIVTKYLDE